MDKLFTYALLAINAFFAVGSLIIAHFSGNDTSDDELVMGQSLLSSLLGWGMCLVMLIMLIIKLIKPSSWPDNPVYMYLTAAITLIGSLITLRSILLDVRVKEEGLEIRTVLKRRAFYYYRDIELEGKCSNQLVTVSSRRGRLCTFSAKEYGAATMIRRWHEAMWQ